MKGGIRMEGIKKDGVKSFDVRMSGCQSVRMLECQNVRMPAMTEARGGARDGGGVSELLPGAAARTPPA